MNSGQILFLPSEGFRYNGPKKTVSATDKRMYENLSPAYSIAAAVSTCFRYERQMLIPIRLKDVEPKGKSEYAVTRPSIPDQVDSILESAALISIVKSNARFKLWIPSMV